TNTLSIKRNGENMTGQDGLYGTASIDSTSKEIIIKLVNVLPESKSIKLNLNGMHGHVQAKMISLFNQDVQAFNTIEMPAKVTPATGTIAVDAGSIALNMEGSSFKVIRVPLNPEH
ncbi:MAG: alpha-L-arabinofuranosidase, partial [Saprospiraceae bacterium]